MSIADQQLDAIRDAVAEMCVREFPAWVDYESCDDASAEPTFQLCGDHVVIGVTVQFELDGTAAVHQETHRYSLDELPELVAWDVLARLVEIHAAVWREGDLGENVERFRQARRARGEIAFGERLVALSKGAGGPIDIHTFAMMEEW